MNEITKSIAHIDTQTHPCFVRLHQQAGFEILNEASIRMPKYAGMALSVVGALVLGDPFFLFLGRPIQLVRKITEPTTLSGEGLIHR